MKREHKKEKEAGSRVCEYPDCVNMKHERNRITADVRPVKNTTTGELVYLCKDCRYGRMV